MNYSKTTQLRIGFNMDAKRDENTSTILDTVHQKEQSNSTEKQAEVIEERKNASDSHDQMEIDEDSKASILEEKSAIENEPSSMDTTQTEISSQPEADIANNKENGEDMTRSSSNNSLSLAKSDGEQCHTIESNDSSDIKKTGKKGAKKNKKPEELLQCTVCGRQGLTSEFCASGRFCSQRCVGAHASKCRADTLAAAAAAGENVEPRKRKKHRKDGGKKSAYKKKGYSVEKRERFSPNFKHAVSSTSLTNGPNEDVRSKKSKSSQADDAYFFYSAVGKEKPFDWDLYLSITGKEAVPIDVFKEENPKFEVFPKPANEFLPGMKLEAVDPRHPSCICVVSVVETQGARLRLHFDGWSESYDFWTNSDSHLLFPAEFCSKYQQKLHPPRGISKADFNWNRYLEETGSEAAPMHLFREIPETLHGFTTKMKLEAVDKKNPDLTCVASINNVIGDYFLVHFDEWDDTYDYWCTETCPYLHPTGWCKENGIRLTPPQDDQVDTFTWDEYLTLTDSIPVPVELLKPRAATNFKVGQKIEVVDPRNQSLVRVATISLIEDFQLKIHFDGWDEMYDFWFDSESNDLHPVGWCDKTGYTLEPPPSFLDAQDTTLCPTPGCRGIGHVKGAKYTTHHSIFGCPYSPNNVTRGSPLVDRLANNSMGEEQSIASRVYNCSVPKSFDDVFPVSTPKGEFIKQQKLLKGIVGRPAKKSTEKQAMKSTKIMSKDFTKFSLKDKSKINKKFIASDNGSSPTSEITSSRKVSFNGHKAEMRSNVPIIKVMNKDERKLKFESSQIKTWSVREVAQFIRSIGLVEHALHFEEQQIDGEALLLLSQADMIHHLKIKLGPALKIANAITKSI